MKIAAEKKQHDNEQRRRRRRRHYTKFNHKLYGLSVKLTDINEYPFRGCWNYTTCDDCRNVSPVRRIKLDTLANKSGDRHFSFASQLFDTCICDSSFSYSLARSSSLSPRCKSTCCFNSNFQRAHYNYFLLLFFRLKISHSNGTNDMNDRVKTKRSQCLNGRDREWVSTAWNCLRSAPLKTTATQL